MARQRLFSAVSRGAAAKGYVFFNDDRLNALIDKKTKRAFNKVGAAIRRKMQQGMKKVGATTGHSEPGKYPKFSDSGAPIKKTIVYIYDSRRNSVIIGPKIGSHSIMARPAGGKTVPQVVNEGGIINNRTAVPILYNASKRKFLSLGTEAGAKIARTIRQAKRSGKKYRGQWRLTVLAAGPRRIAARPFTTLAYRDARADVKLRQAFRETGA